MAQSLPVDDDLHAEGAPPGRNARHPEGASRRPPLVTVSTVAELCAIRMLFLAEMTLVRTASARREEVNPALALARSRPQCRIPQYPNPLALEVANRCIKFPNVEGEVMTTDVAVACCSTS